MVSEFGESVDNDTEEDVEVDHTHQEEEEEIVEEPSEVVSGLRLVVRVGEGISDAAAAPHAEAEHVQETVGVVAAHGEGVVLDEDHGVLQSSEVGQRGENVHHHNAQQTSHQKLPYVLSHRFDHIFEDVRPEDEVQQHEREEELGDVDAQHRGRDVGGQVQQVGVDQQGKEEPSEVVEHFQGPFGRIVNFRNLDILRVEFPVGLLDVNFGVEQDPQPADDQVDDHDHETQDFDDSLESVFGIEFGVFGGVGGEEDEVGDEGAQEGDHFESFEVGQVHWNAVCFQFLEMVHFLVEVQVVIQKTLDFVVCALPAHCFFEFVLSVFGQKFG